MSACFDNVEKMNKKLATENPTDRNKESCCQNHAQRPSQGVQIQPPVQLQVEWLQ